MRKICVLVSSIIAMVLLSLSTAEAQRVLKNNTGLPSLNVHRFTNDKTGDTRAELFMTGKEIELDSMGRPAKGEGYIQATTNDFIPVMVSIDYTNAVSGGKDVEGFCLRVGKVEWDASARIINVSDIRSPMKGTEGLKKLSLESWKWQKESCTLDLSFEGLGVLSLQFQWGGTRSASTLVDGSPVKDPSVFLVAPSAKTRDH